MGTQKDYETNIEFELDIDEPPMYRVFLLNDDYTSMDFVVNILMDIFQKTYQEAEKVMLDVHQNGKGLCGIYRFEIAETKVEQVHTRAKDSGFPLRVVMEDI